MFYPLGSVTASSAEQNQAFATSWWLIALRGVAAIFFGAAALAFPAETLFVLVIVFAAACLVDGGANLVLAVQCARAGLRWGFLAVHGLVAVAIGASIFFWPHVTTATLAALAAAWCIVSGLLVLDLAILMVGAPGRWLLSVIGASSVLFGLFLLIAPALGMLVLVWWFGISAIWIGVALLVLAFSLRRYWRDSGVRTRSQTPSAWVA